MQTDPSAETSVNQRCLITGGTGFLGRRIVALLKDAGYHIRILSRYSNQEFPRCDLISGDLLNRKSCKDALDGVELVVHAAGEKSDPKKIWPVNFNATRNLLAECEGRGIKRFVYISSVGVIGADPLRRKIFDEKSACRPKNAYESSKYEAEKLVLDSEGRMPVAVLRPANVFGENDPRCGLLTLIRNVKRQRFSYMGGRNTICNYVHVDDVGHAVLMLLRSPTAIGKIYHLADSCTIEAFVSAIADELGIKRPRFEMPTLLANAFIPLLNTARRWSTPLGRSILSRLIALNNKATFNSMRIRKELEFRYPIGWREGIRRVVRSYVLSGLV